MPTFHHEDIGLDREDLRKLADIPDGTPVRSCYHAETQAMWYRVGNQTRALPNDHTQSLADFTAQELVIIRELYADYLANENKSTD